MSTKHIVEPWQGGDGLQTTRLWAHVAGGDVIIADFSVSSNLRQEVKVANARRARVCVRLCEGMSTEEIERMLKLGDSLQKIQTDLNNLIGFKATPQQRDKL